MTLARTPYARLSPADIGQVDRELKKLEQMSNGLYVPRVLVAARSPYTVQGTDTMLLCDCTAGPVTLTFPLAARVDGMQVQVVKSDTSTNAVTLSGTFSGVVNPTITVAHAGFTVFAMSAAYHITSLITFPIVAGETGVVSIVYPYGDVRRFGATGVAGIDARTAFAAADAAAVAGYGANKAVRVPAGTHRFTTNITFASAMVLEPGAILKPDSGVTLTFSGPFRAGRYQCLDVSAGGIVRFNPGSVRKIYPEWFGADPTNVNDSTAALQATLDTALASNFLLGAVLTIVLTGRYKITNSLRGFYWNAGAFSFTTFHIEGARSYNGGKAVEINPTFTDRPALILQALRGTSVKGVSFVGALPNVLPTYENALRDTGGTAGTPWWNSGSVGRDQQYSPYCAIALDPFSNGVPSDGGYPGHNGVAGSTNYYTQNVGSSGPVFEDCHAIGFIVGYAHSLSPLTQNGDITTYENCIAEYVKVAFAIGQSQTRGVRIVQPSVTYAQTVFDGVRYGVGNAAFPLIRGGVIAGVAKWLLIGNTSWAPGSIKGLYAESLWSVGYWGWNTGGYPLTLDDCQLNLMPQSAVPGVPNPGAHLHATGPVLIRGGNLGRFNNFYDRISIFSSAKIVFDGVDLAGEPVVSNFSIARFRDCPNHYTSGGGAYGITDRITDVLANSFSNTDAIIAGGGEILENPASTDYKRFRYRQYVEEVIIDAALAVTVNGDGTATATSAQAATRLQVGDHIVARNGTWNAEKYDPALANVAYIGMSMGLVQSIVGNVVTFAQVPISMVSATHNVSIRRLPRYKPRTIGASTNGSNSVTSVNPTGMWKVGDRINNTSWFPVGTYITAIVGTTFTMSQNALANSPAELYDAKFYLEDAAMAAQPTTDVYFVGDFIRNVAGTKDVNNLIPEGWRCTVSGRADGVAPAATFETIYGKTTSP